MKEVIDGILNGENWLIFPGESKSDAILRHIGYAGTERISSLEDRVFTLEQDSQEIGEWEIENMIEDAVDNIDMPEISDEDIDKFETMYEDVKKMHQELIDKQGVL